MAERLAVQAAKNYLQQAEACIATLNPEIRVTLEEETSTDITGAILEKAEEQRVDLIVIHATMKGIMTGLLTSHVPSTVLCRTSKKNVMIMPGKLVDALAGDTYEKYLSDDLLPYSLPDKFLRVLHQNNHSRRYHKGCRRDHSPACC